MNRTRERNEGHVPGKGDSLEAQSSRLTESAPAAQPALKIEAIGRGVGMVPRLQKCLFLLLGGAARLRKHPVYHPTGGLHLRLTHTSTGF